MKRDCQVFWSHTNTSQQKPKPRYKAHWWSNCWFFMKTSLLVLRSAQMVESTASYRSTYMLASFLSLPRALLCLLHSVAHGQPHGLHSSFSPPCFQMPPWIVTQLWNRQRELRITPFWVLFSFLGAPFPCFKVPRSFCLKANLLSQKNFFNYLYLIWISI